MHGSKIFAIPVCIISAVSAISAISAVSSYCCPPPYYVLWIVAPHNYTNGDAASPKACTAVWGSPSPVLVLPVKDKTIKLLTLYLFLYNHAKRCVSPAARHYLYISFSHRSKAPRLIQGQMWPSMSTCITSNHGVIDVAVYLQGVEQLYRST